MTIIYSCIARGSTILCSHGVQTGTSDYEQAVATILPQIPTRNDGKTTVNASNTKFHCIVENGIIFLCAAKPGTETRPCFAYLTELKDQFHNQNFAEQAVTARPHEFDSQFNSVMAKQMDRYSKKNATDNLTVLQGQVKEVTGVMSQNIESVIQRGERLDDLMDKTDELEAASATFQRTATKIRKKYWWKNFKMKIIVGCVVFVVVVGIVLAILYGSGIVPGDSSSSKTTALPPTPTSKSP
ncbi:uncharacterized protein LOC132753427 isoform X2 [Ruditapes philippinarum]|nr:uncharacterized protein LOC132753427 isoform X2 [Ruditapes philippinarum]XP_060599877.1 uncharacterized protein LOC132753427 isoform X2 [Ruditapes philippinarum]